MIRRRRRPTPRVPTPPAWCGMIGPGKRWRTRRAYLNWCSLVWRAQPRAVRITKVSRWACEVLARYQAARA